MPSERVKQKNIEIGARVAALRESLGLTQDELARKVGYTASSSRSSIQKIESGKSGIPQSKLADFAEALNTTIPALMGLIEPQVTDDVVTYEIIGDIAAGYEGRAEEEYTGIEISIPKEWLKGRPKSDYFMLRVKGDSMYPTYQEGDIILVKRQITLDHSGQIGVVMFEDTNATLKKVEYVYGEDWMRLIPINPQYPPIMVENEALEHCRVLGYPVKLIREIH